MIKGYFYIYFDSHSLTLYFPMFPFHPPENIRKPLVFLCFQGDQMGTLGSKGLKYNNFLLLGDFNSQPTEEAMKSFCQIYSFKNLLDKPTCYKNSTNPSCVDLIITNKLRSFQNCCTFENGLSDFHKVTLTVLNHL